MAQPWRQINAVVWKWRQDSVGLMDIFPEKGYTYLWFFELNLMKEVLAVVKKRMSLRYDVIEVFINNGIKYFKLKKFPELFDWIEPIPAWRYGAAIISI